MPQHNISLIDHTLPYSCVVCGKRWSSILAARDHYYRHTWIKRFWVRWTR